MGIWMKVPVSWKKNRNTKPVTTKSRNASDFRRPFSCRLEMSRKKTTEWTSASPNSKQFTVEVVCAVSMEEWTKDEGRSDSNWLTFVTHSSCKLTNTVTVNTTEPTVPILPPLLSHQLGTHLSHFTLLFFESTFNILRHGRLKTNDHTT